MANILLLYATREGQTRKIASRIARVMREAGNTVRLVDADKTPADLVMEEFEAVCIGAPIHASGYPRSIIRFVRAHRAELQRKRAAFFSVGLAVASRTTDGRSETKVCIASFIKKTGWKPARVELFAGALPYSQYNFLIRAVMRSIARRAGGDTDTTRDYEYTDWQAVDAFARDFAAPQPAAVTQREAPACC